MMEISPNDFDAFDYLGFLRRMYFTHGKSALWKQFRYDKRRPFSRQLIKAYSPSGFGLEIGVGNQSIAPTSRTILSDSYPEHGSKRSLARRFFAGDNIPFASESFDFILSEHVLEHVANPLGMLREWLRVLRKGGHIFLFLPHKQRTFDRFRERTPLAHLISDEKSGSHKGDTTHLADWLTNVINRGLASHYAGLSPEEMIDKACIHHHVWTTDDILEVMRYLEQTVVFAMDRVPDRPDSFVVISRKSR